jgi:hypothetical protein
MALLLSGCASQVDALAPVGGDDIQAVRTAAIDVLLEARLTPMEAPVCTYDGAGVACSGSLTDGSAVVVIAPGKHPTDMTVKVGSTLLYDGPVQDVLDKAAQGQTP